MFTPDDGYYFGLGAFETIALEEGRPQFLREHLQRLETALKFFSLPVSVEQIREAVEEALSRQEARQGRRALKVAVSRENLLVTTRENPYCREDYLQGFDTDYSAIRRNETSPFSYHKTLNCGDGIWEKRRAAAAGIREPIFLNTRGQIAEGATTNVFFIREGRLVTPPLSCGMLPGILRAYLCRIYETEEKIVLPEEVAEYEEMFVTNSLLGIMPVRRLGQHTFSGMERGLALARMFFDSHPGEEV